MIKISTKDKRGSVHLNFDERIKVDAGESFVYAYIGARMYSVGITNDFLTPEEYAANYEEWYKAKRKSSFEDDWLCMEMEYELEGELVISTVAIKNTGNALIVIETLNEKDGEIEAELSEMFSGITAA